MKTTPPDRLLHINQSLSHRPHPRPQRSGDGVCVWQNSESLAQLSTPIAYRDPHPAQFGASGIMTFRGPRAADAAPAPTDGTPLRTPSSTNVGREERAPRFTLAPKPPPPPPVGASDLPHQTAPCLPQIIPGCSQNKRKPAKKPPQPRPAYPQENLSRDNLPKNLRQRKEISEK